MWLGAGAGAGRTRVKESTVEEPVTQPATTAGTTSTPLQATGTGQQTGGEHPVRVNPLYVPHSPHPFATAPIHGLSVLVLS